MTFSGFRSRWITPRAWAKATGSQFRRKSRSRSASDRTGGCVLGKRGPFHALHHVIRAAIIEDAEVVDRNNPWVVEPRKDPRLEFQTRGEGIPVRWARWCRKHLEHNRPIEHSVVSQINCSHSASRVVRGCRTERRSESASRRYSATARQRRRTATSSNVSEQQSRISCSTSSALSHTAVNRSINARRKLRLAAAR